MPDPGNVTFISHTLSHTVIQSFRDLSNSSRREQPKDIVGCTRVPKIKL